MKENLLSNLWHKDATRSVIASLISILIGLLAGAIVILIVGISNPSLGIKSAWEGIQLVTLGIFSTGRNAAGTLTFGFNSASMGNMLFRSMPLILTGLSVAIAFKTGLFNIGAPGQYLAGTAATLFIALSIPTSSVPRWIIWVLAFLGGMAAGALWGMIPGILKACLNINEVIACIMTNWIAANVVTWLFDISNLKNMVENTKSSDIYSTSYGLTNVDGVLTYVKGERRCNAENGTGQDLLRQPDQRRHSHRHRAGNHRLYRAEQNHAGLRAESMRFEPLCGALRRHPGQAQHRAFHGHCGRAWPARRATLYYLSGNTEFYWSTRISRCRPAGFNGIPVALLAVSNPIGGVFTGMFMSMLAIAGLSQLTQLTAYNEYITDVIIAVIVYLSAFSLLIKNWLSGRQKNKAISADSLGSQSGKAKEEGKA